MLRRSLPLVLGVTAVVIAAAAPAADPPATDAAARRAAILAPATDFSKAERWEDLPGGSATNRTRFDQDAFSQPSSNLTFEQRAQFSIGNGVFRRTWVAAPSSTQSADGLGPLFNARGCQSCHLKDGRGHPPAETDDSGISMFLRLSVPPTTSEEKALVESRRVRTLPEPTYGGQLQDLALPGHPIEGHMRIEYEEVPVALADGETARLRKPSYSISNLGYGPMRSDVLLSPRVAPQMIGLGLVEAIADEDILSHVDPEDRDGDGISGKANRTWSMLRNGLALGRFGWKAGAVTIAEQSSDAMAGDIGIGNPLVPQPWGDCTERQPACRTGPHGLDEAGFEANKDLMDLVFFYARNLAVPARRDAGKPEVLKGKELFYRAGCISCHTPKFATRRDYEIDALAGQLIWPYSDFLLHDMGEGLADDRPESGADGREWRTPPLWGLGFTETVNGHTFLLHDGRARDLAEAILWHGGEAKAARDRYAGMTKADRDAILTFLRSL